MRNHRFSLRRLLFARLTIGQRAVVVLGGTALGLALVGLFQPAGLRSTIPSYLLGAVVGVVVLLLIVTLVKMIARRPDDE
jgi:uncharacterized membrane protein YjfL (UPF0719 family)